MRYRRIFSILLLAAASSVGANTLPNPDLSQVEPAVRGQLEELRAEVDRLLGSDPQEPATLAALSLLADSYLAYDFLGPAEACLRLLPEHGPAAFRSSYLLGYLHERRGELEAATAALERAVDLKPQESPALLRLGKVLLSRYEADAAVPFFERALAADSSCVAALYGLGESARMSGDLESAVDFHTRALEARPDLEQARYSRALSLRQLGRTDEARREMAEVDIERVRLSGNTWEGCSDRLLSEISGLAQSSSAYLMRASLAFIQGDIVREIAEYRRALESNPDDHLAHKSLGAALFRSGETATAIEHFRAAVRIDPEESTYQYDLAQLLRYKGFVAEARKSFHLAIDLNPAFTQAHLKLAEMAVAEGRFEDAVTSCNRALDVEPRNQTARSCLANSLFRLGREAEATAELGRLLDDHPPEDYTARLELASRMLLLGDVERGERHLRAISLSEAAVEVRALALLRIGLIRLGSGDPAAAAATIRDALALDPNVPEGQEALTVALQAASDQSQ